MGLFMDLWILQYLNTSLSFLDLDWLVFYKALLWNVPVFSFDCSFSRFSIQENIFLLARLLHLGYCNSITTLSITTSLFIHYYWLFNSGSVYGLYVLNCQNTLPSISLLWFTLLQYGRLLFNTWVHQNSIYFYPESVMVSSAITWRNRKLLA